MTSEELKAKAQAFLTYMTGHWDWCGPLAGFLAGYVIGKVL